MADIETLISSSIADARESGDLPEAVGEDTGDESTGDEGLETPVEEAVETQEPVEGSKPAVTPPAEEKPVEAKVEAAKVDDPLAKELGPSHDKKGRENRIPHSRVQKIVQNQITKATEPLNTKVKELEGVRGEYEERLNRVGEVESIMFNQQARFLEILQTIPGYKELLSGKVAVAAPVIDPKSEMPKPDVDLGNGKFTYSEEGLQKRLAWEAERTKQSTLEELKPLREQFEGQQRIEAMKPHIDAQIEHAASNWEGFVDHHLDILKALTDDRLAQAKIGKPPKLSLERAYLQVIIPKLKADRTKMREELLAEIQKAPKSTGVPPAKVKAAATDDGPKSIESIIRAQVQTLKR